MILIKYIKLNTGLHQYTIFLIPLVGSSPLIMLNDLLSPYGITPLGLFSVMPIGIVLVVATVLLAPLVVTTAQAIGADPRAAALVVGLSTSNAFLLPTHQVNAFYMGPGKYRSSDFLKAGAPLSVIFLMVGMVYYFFDST